MLVFGIGMGLVVAPLTTTVMAALSSEYSGTASGVNNAVSRIAGVLALAVLGSVALLAFSGSLVEQTRNISLDNGQRRFLLAQANALGAALPPAGLDTQTSQAVQSAISQSFVSAYRLVMLVCAGLAWLSSLAAALLIGGRAGSTIPPQLKD